MFESVDDVANDGTMHSQRTAVAVKAPQVHAEGPAVDEALVGKRVDGQQVVVIPAIQTGTSAHDANDGVGAVVSDAKDLLGDPGRCVCHHPVLVLRTARHDSRYQDRNTSLGRLTADGDIVGHVLKVGVAGAVFDTALGAEVHGRGG